MRTNPMWTVTDINNKRVTNQLVLVTTHFDMIVETAEEAENQALADKKVYPELLYVYIPAPNLSGYFKTEFYEKANKKTDLVSGERG